MTQRSRNSCEEWLATTIPSAFLLFLGHSAFAETTATFERLTTSGGRTTLGSHVAPLDDGSISVESGVQTLLEGSVEYSTDNGTCTFTSSGSYSATNNPSHGMLSYGILDHTVQSSDVCNGKTFPYAVVYYTWTDNQSGATEDSFAVEWATPDGKMGGPYGYTVELQASPSFTLSVLSPFLLGSSSLADIELQSLLPNISDLNTVAAEGLSADGVSAAIVLVSTNTQSDVTLTADSNTTLLPYDPQFLTYPPASGSSTSSIPKRITHRSDSADGSTLTISASDFFQIGALFYAAALVQTPPASTPPSYTTPIVLTAQQQQGMVQQVNLPFTPPPVILVPGLWSTSSSLEPMANYLESVAPWNVGGIPVSVAHYDGSKAFNSKDGANAIDAQVSSSYALLDQAHIVGGRVDIVAHSMGGLVVRDYASQANYPSLRDRQFGKFHTVVSLDTPELGSKLASWLVKNQGRKYNDKSSAVSSALWNAHCNTTDTIAQCFSKLGYAIAGAVNSLKPNNKILNGTPSPVSLSNITWRSVSAIRPDASSGKKKGAEQYELEEIVAATYAKTDTIPTITGVLGDSGQDDAVVPLTSQLGGAPSGPTDFKTFPNLSHNPVLPLPNLSNANVQTDSSVEALVACWLASAGGACQGGPKGSENFSQDDAQSVPQSFRISEVSQFKEKQFSLSPFDAKLADSVAVRVQCVNSSGVQRAYLTQTSDQGKSDFTELSVSQITNTLYTVLFTPMTLKQTKFRFVVVFKDGTMSAQEIPKFVGAPDILPQALFTDINVQRAYVGGRSTRYANPVLHLKENVQGNYTLESRASFASIPNQEVDLTGMASYKVVSESGEPCVKVDRNGKVFAIHGGIATIETHLGRMVDTLRVSVP